MVQLKIISLALAISAGAAFVLPFARTPSSRLHAVNIPDSVKSMLSADEVKTLQAEAEKAIKLADSDVDPWFGEAEADGNTFASFELLEEIATPKNETEEALVAEDGVTVVAEDAKGGAIPSPPKKKLKTVEVRDEA